MLVANGLRGLLFGVAPRDPATLASLAVLLPVVALLACALPAWRAARRPPMQALQAE
jgi:ABC-type lipoprotein release transport system permease subunit